MTARAPKAIAAAKSRCAVYTRKSSEEGLEQDYNSLHAQRDACEAYIRSQAGEGWTALPQAYDDGGISGGTLERPGLKQLMADIEAGRIDVVVVYKVDRLTRSLTDFARIVDRFDAKGVSFVSVTQAFNTTTSMGRLTLNVLLSFAQFEREVTGERIRDKIAASKRKGMWMGGSPPLGYDRPTAEASHKLVINPADAATVRHIFARYLELGSVHVLQRDLETQGVLSKITVSRRSGTVRGGVPLNRGALFHLLKNRTYLGEIVHRQESYPGLHDAIVDRDVFDAVAERLAGKTATSRPRRARAAPAPLRGLIFDQDGAPMSPTASEGRGGLYRYYVSAPLQQGRQALDGAIRRVPAPQMEAFVTATTARIVGPALDAPRARRIEVHADAVHLLFDRAELLGTRRDAKAALAALNARFDVGEQARIDGASVRITLPRRMRFVGGRTWMTDARNGAIQSHGRTDPALAAALKSAHAKLNAIGVAPTSPPERLHDAKGLDNPHLRMIARLAFLAPDIQDAILDGRLAPHHNVQAMTLENLPLAWADQRALFGLSGAN